MSQSEQAPRADIAGEFWLASEPGFVAPGKLHIERGVLEMQRELVPCMTTQHSEGDITKQSPIDDLDDVYRIHGRGDGGELITIPAAVRGACEHKVEPESQEFHVLQWLVGHHVGETDPFVRLDSEWGLDLGDWSGPLTISGIGQVHLTTSGRQLVVSDLPGLSVSTTLRRVLEPFRALLETTTWGKVAPLRVHLADAQGVSIDVHHTPAPLDALEIRDGVFNHARLRNAHINRWFDVTSKTHPILFVAARALNGRENTLEAQTMTLGAVCEGMHEQLHGQRAIDKQTVKELQGAASAAVPDEYSERVSGALSQLGGQTFRDRLTWLAENLEPFATQLCGLRESSPDRDADQEEPSTASGTPPRNIWLKNVMAARNNFAHQKPENPHDLDQYVLRSLALRDVVRWFVTACILRELEIPVTEIANEFKRRPSFHVAMTRARNVFPDIYGPAPDGHGLGFDWELEQ